MLRAFTALYAALTGLASLGLARIRKLGVADEDSLPKLAVIVAARNEQKNMPDLIAALSAQDYPEHLVDFWIVDDDSEDATWAIAHNAASSDKRFHAIRSNPLSAIASPKKRALDTAIQRCDAEWIVTTDADCTPGPGWLKALAACMDEGVGAVVGYAPLVGVEDPVQAVSAGESWSSALLSSAAIGLGYPFNAFGRNFAYRRQLYFDLGGYGDDGSVASGDDDLLLQRISALTNWRAVFAADPRAHVPSAVPPAEKLLGTKARHLSVGPRYAPGWVAIGAAASVLFMGLGIATIASLFGLVPKSAVAKAWSRKWMMDLALIVSGYRVLGDAPRAAMAMGTSSVAPFLLWAIWPRALFGNVTWKGRTFVRGRVGDPLEDVDAGQYLTTSLDADDRTNAR